MTGPGLASGGAGFKSLIGLPWQNNTADSSNPSAGNEASVTVPSGETWEILGIRVQLTTSSTLAKRIHNIAIVRNSVTILLFGNPTYQMFSMTRLYQWIAAYPTFVNDLGPSNQTMIGPLPPKLIVDAGDVIQTSTTNIQTGDDYGVMTVLSRRYRNISKLSLL